MQRVDITTTPDLSDLPFEPSEIRLVWRDMDRSRKGDGSIKRILLMIAQSAKHIRALIADGKLTYDRLASDLDRMAAEDDPDNERGWSLLVSMMAAATVLRGAGRHENDDGVSVIAARSALH